MNSSNNTGRSAPRLVVSLTTIPSRLILPRIVEVLASIGKQTRQPDALYLGLPQYCHKTKSPYPPIPSAVKRLCKTIQLPTDYGPITKILAGLLVERDPSTIIITCDDDTVYPSTMLQELAERSEQFPQAAIGSAGIYLGQFPGYMAFSTVANQCRKTGLLGLVHSIRNWWDISLSPSVPREADILCGFASIAYRRGFFPLSFAQIEAELLSKTLSDPHVRIHDDVLLSGYMSLRHVPRLLFALTPVQNQSGPDAINSSALAFVPAFVNAVQKCREWNMFANPAHLSLSERLFHTCSGPLLLFLSLACVIFILRRLLKR